jgi:hypothetical protein
MELPGQSAGLRHGEHNSKNYEVPPNCSWHRQSVMDSVKAGTSGLLRGIVCREDGTSGAIGLPWYGVPSI